jgi:thymidylate synthase
VATVVIDSLQLSYNEVLKTVYERASINQPRGKKVYDAGHITIEIVRPDLPQLPVQTGRGINIDIAAIEALQLIAGEDKSEALLRIAPQFKEYTDITGSGDDGDPIRRYFHGNYGARMSVVNGHDCGEHTYHYSWLECVVHKIKTDADTRQAVVNIWDNSRDNGEHGKHDYPCTVALGFRMIRGRLEMYVTMRSNDAWLGLPLDVFQFNQAHHTVANMLSVPLGTYYHTAWSLHLYDEHVRLISQTRNRRELSKTILPYGFTHVHEAVSIVDGWSISDDAPSSHRWYHDRLHKYLKPDYDENEEKTDG